MTSKRKPLDDARRRVKEKLSAIDEQKDFIQNSVEQLTNGVKHAANSLLTEGNKTKFFQKYRAVSQELEKCLDDLLLISAAISSLEDEEEEESAGSEEDDKPPDDLSPTTSHEEQSPVRNYPKHQENEPASCAPSVKSLPTEENPTLISSPADTTKDLIDFETQTPSVCVKENISESSHSLSDFERDHHALKGNHGDILATNNCQQAPLSFNLIESSSRGVKGNESNNNSPIPDPTKKEASLAFDLIDIGEPTLPTSLQLQKVCDKKTENNNNHNSPKEEGRKQIAVDSSLDSTSYVNDLFMSSPPLNLQSTAEAVDRSSRRSSFDSFVEESGKILDVSGKDTSNEVGNGGECSSPTAVRLKRIGFCEYKSQEQVTTMSGIANDIGEQEVVANERDGLKLKLNENNEAEITTNESEKPKITASYNEKLNTKASDIEKPNTAANNIEKHKTTANNIEKHKTTANNIDKNKTTANIIEKPKTTASNIEKPKTTANNIEKPKTTASNIEKPKTTASNIEKPKTTANNIEKPKTTANNIEKPKTTANNIEKPKTTANNIEKPEMLAKSLKSSKMLMNESDKAKMNDSGKAQKTLNKDEKSEICFEAELSQATEKTVKASQECTITSNETKIEISGQCQLVTTPCQDETLIPNSEAKSQVHVQKATDKIDTFPVSAGDVIEEALREKPTCELADVKGLQIPPFEIPKDKCMKVTVKEIHSPNDFWIQKANDDLDLLMEKMCYHFSKRAKSGDKGGLKDLPGIGHMCCGRYSVDNVWYRALVTAVSRENNHVTVLYVDEGNSEALPLSRLRELDEKFASLPCQALRVQLRGLELGEDINMDEVNDWLRRRVSGETLEAVLYENDANISPVSLDLYIRPHARSVSDVDYHKLEYNIHEMLIREGFAIRAASPQSTGTSDDVSPPSSPSDHVVKSESILSSSVTSGFHDAPSPLFDVNTHDVTSPGCHGDGVVCHVPPPHIPVDSDGSVYMLVSHIVSPGEFYVHFISSEAGMLDCLMTDMNQTYKDLESQDSDSFSPGVGDFCCAKFSADGNWYRGLVLKVRWSGNSGENGLTVEVFYVDFGNIEEVNVGDLRVLLPQFISTPAQVVRCSLADVNPSIKQELDCDVFYEDLTSEDDSKSRLSRQRSHRNKTAAHKKAIVIAAGDEDSEDEIPNGDMDLLGLLPDIEKHDHRDRLRSSISDDIAKSYQEQSLFSDTAVELFEKIWSGVEEISLIPSWSENATEYFKTLTLNAQKLVGYVVPWDSAMLNNIVNYSQGGECSLPNLGPVLRLNLYDVSGDNDVFINAAMVRAKYASSNSIKDEQVVVSDEVSCSTTENTSEDLQTSLEDVPVVRVSQSELSSLAETSQDSRSTPPPSLDPSSPSSPLSPTSKLLDAWNPMSHDYQAFRNAYDVQTDNLDVAITGYAEDRGKICRFYRTKYGCFRGRKCLDKHIEQDVSDKVFIFGSAANPMKLPEVGAWVLVKITAIYNPSHFWVQLPSGVENLTSQLIKHRSGKETSGEENLKDFNNLMKEMCEFYSKTFRRERSLVPPSEGELVVIRSEVDNKWYRGQVCQEEKDKKYKILFVDYGITEWLDRTNICPIIPQFLHLPFQSVECYLANIEPKSEDWTEESREHFTSLIVDKTLVCQILAIGSLNKTMSVNLFESDEGESRNITEQMIESGYADEAKFKILKHVDPKSLYAGKSVIVHPG